MVTPQDTTQGGPPLRPRVILVVLAAAFSVSACSVTVGRDRFKSSNPVEYTWLSALGFEVAPRIGADDGAFSEIPMTFVMHNFSPSRSRVASDFLTLFEVDVGWRYVPGTFGRVAPYMGAGLGYYLFKARNVIDTCPPEYYCFGPGFQENEDTKLASGVNPHLLLGLYMPITDSNDGGIAWSVQLEAAYEFLKNDGEFDFTAPRFRVGLRMDPR